MIYFECDLLKREDVHRVFKELESGGVDILINAASIYYTIIEY